MAGPDFVTPRDIRTAFREHLADTGARELAYEDLWRILREQGAQVRGATTKKQRDTVFNALSTDPGVIKVRPGVFRIAD